MNNQTPGPALVIGNRWKLLEIGGEAGMTIAAGDSLDDKRLIPTTNLLAAAYTSFDKAGRELGIDATELARKTDLTLLIRATRNLHAMEDVNGYGARFSPAWYAEYRRRNEALGNVLAACGWPRLPN